MNEETVGSLDKSTTCKSEELEVKNVTSMDNIQQHVSNSLTCVPYFEISANNSLAEADKEETENEEPSKLKRKRLFDDEEEENHIDDLEVMQSDKNEKESNANSSSPNNLEGLANVCMTANRSSLNHAAAQQPGNKMNGNQTNNKTKKRSKPTLEGTKENPINLI